MLQLERASREDDVVESITADVRLSSMGAATRKVEIEHKVVTSQFRADGHWLVIGAGKVHSCL